jgi:hypothetical protein
MSLNLFTKIPQNAPLNFFSYLGGIEALAHMANVILTLIVSLALLTYAPRQKGSLFTKLSFLATVFIA